MTAAQIVDIYEHFDERLAALPTDQRMKLQQAMDDQNAELFLSLFLLAFDEELHEPLGVPGVER